MHQYSSVLNESEGFFYLCWRSVERHHVQAATFAGSNCFIHSFHWGLILDITSLSVLLFGCASYPLSIHCSLCPQNSYWAEERSGIAKILWTYWLPKGTDFDLCPFLSQQVPWNIQQHHCLWWELANEWKKFFPGNGHHSTGIIFLENHIKNPY